VNPQFRTASAGDLSSPGRSPGTLSILSVQFGLEAASHAGGFDELLRRVVDGTSAATFGRKDVEEL
jgi:hypothetical protein